MGCKCSQCMNAYETSELGEVPLRVTSSPELEQWEWDQERARMRSSQRTAGGARRAASKRKIAARPQAQRAKRKAPARKPPGAPQRGAGHRRGPGRHPGFGDGRPSGYPVPLGGVAPGAAPNAVILNRRYADQLGWRNDYDRIVALLGPAAGGGEWPFVQAVAQWQMSKGLTPNGVLGVESWTQMQGDLAQSPEGAPPAGPAPLPLGGAPPALPGAAADEEELEAYSGPRRLAYCPPPVGFSPTDRTVLAVTSRLETGRPFACAVSAESGISVGLGWNLRSGTLQALLARFENQTGRLREFFGADYALLLSLIAGRHSPEKRHRAAFEAISRRLADRWRAPLLRLLADPVFSAMLRHDVRARLAGAKSAAQRLGLWTTRGLALLFDIGARDGLGTAKVERFAARLRRLENARRPPRETDKLLAIADESTLRLTRDREEHRARRTVIATGSGPTRSAWWDLSRDYPNLDAPWQP
jgi:hypothetical protein